MGNSKNAVEGREVLQGILEKIAIAFVIAKLGFIFCLVVGAILYSFHA